MLDPDVIAELIRAMAWFVVGLGMRAAVSSPFAAGWWPNGDGD